MGNGAAAYQEVFILATSGIDPSVIACREWFATHAPAAALRIFVIAGLPDIRNADDHARYEEALFRVYAAASEKSGPGKLDLCLAGGFKTISSAAHQAADLLGCGKLFHITTPATTPEHPASREIFAAIEADLRQAKLHPYLNLVDLGPRPGWPTIQQLLHDAPALPPADAPFLITDTTLREKILNRIREANRLAHSEHELATLPFPWIARWAPAARHWLNQPLDPTADAAWVAGLPKVELHCHLGGFATQGELLQQVRAAALFPENLPPVLDISSPAGWPHPPSPLGLEAYRKLGDNNGSAILRDPGCLTRHIELLYRYFQEQNIVHAEVRCSPANYASPGRSAWEVTGSIRAAFEGCYQQAIKAGGRAPRVDLIIIATRQTAGDFRTGILRHLALAATAFEHWADPAQTRVTGVDLAGFEDKETRAHCFRDDFMAALRLGMGITIHAGENDDAEGIWSAILDLNTRRLGHALHLGASPTLLRTVADRRIGVEMCPYANLQIAGYPLDEAASGSKSPYPLKHYLDAGIPVTVNTDNIGISAATLTENFLLLPRLCPGITRLDILRLIRNAIDQAFLDNARRTHLMKSSLLSPPP